MAKSIAKNIFRTYDIRGRIPVDFTLEDGYTLAHAILTYYQRQDPTLSAIVVGYDARSTSPLLAEQVFAAAHNLGITVQSIGMVSSPEFYHRLHTSPVTSGIMITASHNPAEYNGFKLRLNTQPVWGDEVQAIGSNACHPGQMFAQSATSKEPGPDYERQRRNIIRSTKNTTLTTPDNYAAASRAQNGSRIRSTSSAGTTVRDDDRKTPYVADLAQRFTHLKRSSLHAIIDCGNGATGPAIIKIIEALEMPNVTLLYTTPDGTFPNHSPDSSNAKNLTELISQVKTADEPTIGLALDGDGDRLGLVLEDGTHLSGDDLLALLAQPVLEENPGTHVVYDIKSSSRLTRVIPSLDGTGHFTPCGHTYIQNAMREHNALVGGEVSGHLFFRDRYFGFDDGIYALLRVLELRMQNKQALVERFAQLPVAYTAPEQRIACEDKNRVVDRAITRAQTIEGARLITTDGIRIELPEGWLLIRAAQTEPAISVRWEGTTPQAMQIFKNLLQELLAAEALQQQ